MTEKPRRCRHCGADLIKEALFCGDQCRSDFLHGIPPAELKLDDLNGGSA